MERDYDKEWAFEQVEYILNRDEAIQTIVNWYVEVSQNPDKEYSVSGLTLQCLYHLIRRYADELKELEGQSKPDAL